MILPDLLQQLQAEGLIESQPLPDEPTGMPWYLSFASAFGAWLAALFLFVFSMAFVWNGGLASASVGLLQVGAAAFWARRDRLDFATHFSLALWMTGCGMLLYGVCSSLDGQLSLWAGVAVCLVLSLFYPYPGGRLLTVLAAGGFVLALVCIPESIVPADAAVFVLATLGGACWLARESFWQRGWAHADVVYGTGALATLLGVLIVSYWDWAAAPAGLGSSLLLSCCSLWLVSKLMQRLQLSPRVGLWALGGVLALAAVTYRTPGIIGGFGVMLLAFQARSWLLMSLAKAFLWVFAWVYYYNLELPLLEKSLVMFATGALLLVLRAGFKKL